MSQVHICGLSRSFGRHRVLEGVDLDIADGEIMAVLGPSGCGKTTMLRILAGFLAPDSGTVTFGGTVVAADTTSLPPQRRRRRGPGWCCSTSRSRPWTRPCG